ncbi:MAG: O-antigen ligase family protein [Gammaproteobacteria bacterium]
MAASHCLSNRLFYAYIAILCWAPLPLASNRPWAWNLLSLLCLLLAIAAVLQLRAGECSVWTRLKPHRISIGLLALAPLWAMLQTLPLPASMLAALSSGHASILQITQLPAMSISLDAALTRQLALLGLAFWLMYVLTLLLLDSPRRMRTLMFALVLSGLFQALYGSFMTLSGLEYGFFTPKTAYLGMATGTFVNRNHLAGYLELCLAVGIGLLIASMATQQHRHWRDRLRAALDSLLGPKIRLRVFLALMVVALVLTRSRMGNAAFFISLPLWGLLLMVLQRRFHRGAIVLFLSLMLVDFAIVGQWFGFDELAQRLQATSAESESRDEVVRDSATLLQDYAVTGSGVGTWHTAFPRYRGADIPYFYDHAHNDYLELGSDFGVIGMAALALSVLYALYAAMKSMALRHDQLALGVAFAASMGLTCLLLHSFVDFNLQIPANALLLVVLLAFAHLSRSLPREQHGYS